MDMSSAEVKPAAVASPPAQSPSSASPPELNGSEILVRCLQAENVKFMWGYPGGAVLYIYDALYKHRRVRAREDLGFARIERHDVPARVACRLGQTGVVVESEILPEPEQDAHAVGIPRGIFPIRERPVPAAGA